LAGGGEGTPADYAEKAPEVCAEREELSGGAELEKQATSSP